MRNTIATATVAVLMVLVYSAGARMNAQPSAEAAAFGGKWSVAVQMGPNEQTAELDVKVDGTTVSGTMLIDHAGELKLEQARVEAGSLLFSIVAMDQPTNFSIQLKDAQSLIGTMEGPMGKLALTGKRK